MIKNKKMLIILILLLVVGFATVSTTLMLSGLVGVSENKDDFNVIFTEARLNGVIRNNFIDKSTKQTITYETDVLSLVNDTSILEYEVTNTSRNYDADVTINLEVPVNDNVEIEYEPKSMVISAGESKKGTVTVKLIKPVTEDKRISVKCEVNAVASKRESLGEEYIEPFSRAGTLMASATYGDTVDGIPDPNGSTGAFWDYKANITRVVFEKEMTRHETSDDLIFDVSENQDKSVMSYLVLNEDATTYTLYIQSNGGVIANSNSDALFHGFSKLTTIEGLEYFDTENVTSMDKMFEGCSSLTSLDLRNFNTGKVTNIRGMFELCSKLTSLDLSSFDTSNVVSMGWMFNGCSSLTSLDVSHFDTSKVTKMPWMFQDCSRVTSLDVSHFDTSKVTNMTGMFQRCGSLSELDVSGFDTSNVTLMNFMFTDCRLLTQINVSNFDTSKLTTMASMFQNCNSVGILDVHNFNTSQITDMTSMFYGCSGLTNLDISNFDVSNVTHMDSMFNNCTGLKNLNLGVFDTSKVDYFWMMFSNIPDDTLVYVSHENTQKWVLNLADSCRPSAWSKDNVIVIT